MKKEIVEMYIAYYIHKSDKENNSLIPVSLIRGLAIHGWIHRRLRISYAGHIPGCGSLEMHRCTRRCLLWVGRQWWTRPRERVIRRLLELHAVSVLLVMRLVGRLVGSFGSVGVRTRPWWLGSDAMVDIFGTRGLSKAARVVDRHEGRGGRGVVASDAGHAVRIWIRSVGWKSWA